MNQKRRNGSRAIAALLLFSITQIGLATRATAIPQQFVAGLTTRNNQPITVNGLSANTGASIVTGTTVDWERINLATVNLGSLGTLDIAPNTKLVLTVLRRSGQREGVDYGCAILTAKKKTKGEIATEQGSAGKTDPAAGGVLDVCFPQGATAPPSGRCGGSGSRSSDSADGAGAADSSVSGSGHRRSHRGVHWRSSAGATHVPGQSQRLPTVKQIQVQFLWGWHSLRPPLHVVECV